MEGLLSSMQWPFCEKVEQAGQSTADKNTVANQQQTPTANTNSKHQQQTCTELTYSRQTLGLRATHLKMNLTGQNRK